MRLADPDAIVCAYTNSAACVLKTSVCRPPIESFRKRLLRQLESYEVRADLHEIDLSGRIVCYPLWSAELSTSCTEAYRRAGVAHTTERGQSNKDAELSGFCSNKCVGRISFVG